MGDKPVAVRHRSQEIGQVVSRAGNKTVVVSVSRQVPHPLYARYVQRRKKFHVHDEKNECQVGDWVRFAECRPLSRRKRWRLRAIIQKAAPGSGAVPTEVV
ncbi:MAG TPA: 30S ribosomal protein S17 [Terriglobia bacterium]|nr:30S ribosomal protein S17 [Terriglobia bacterium]